MKRTIVITILSVLAFALTACGASARPAQSNPSNGGFSGGAGFTSGPSGLQLAAGMIKLDGTQYAVTPLEASKLLPLWKNLEQTESILATPRAFPTPDGTTTPGPRFDPATMQKIGSEVSAIESAMDPAQLQAIETMNLNRQDITADLQQAGIQMGNFGQGGFQGNGTFTPPNGTPRAFGTPGAFQGQADSGTPGAFQRGTRGAFVNFIPPSVVAGIVQWLQTKAAS